MLVSLEEFKSSRYYRADWTDSECQEALEYAEERFYRFTNREKHGYWLEPRELALSLDGTGHKLLRSPYPVLSLSSVVLRTREGEEDVTAEVTFRGHYLHREDGFPYGFANVSVSGAFGDPAYAGRAIPRDVKEAVMRLAYRKLLRTRIAGERLYERRAPGEEVPPPTLTGDRETDAIIRTYTVGDITGTLDLRGPEE